MSSELSIEFYSLSPLIIPHGPLGVDQIGATDPNWLPFWPLSESSILACESVQRCLCQNKAWIKSVDNSE